MAYSFGIYFGGSSMNIAYCKDDQCSIIVNESGYRSTPSMFAINANEFSVGLPVKQNLIRNSSNTISYAKHFIVDPADSNQNQYLLDKLECEVKTQNNELRFLLEKNEKPFEIGLEEVIQKELEYLCDLAKVSLSVKECDAFLSVPMNFTPIQTQFLENCARKAGFNVLRSIRNPIAACLAYELEDDNSTDSTLLVYQMGGNSIEVTLIQLTNGLYRLVDSIHVQNLGGDQFTDLIVDILCEEFEKKHKCSPRKNKRALFKLKSNAEELKQILSTMERVHCSIDALCEGIDFDYYLTRQRFESACVKLYQQTLSPIDDLLKRNQLNESDINQVILCGASTKMTKLQALIKDRFVDAKLLNYQSPDECIALGCAKQCLLSRNSKIKQLNKEDSMFKCLSKPIYLRVGSKGSPIQIFKANTPIPLRKEIQVEIDLNEPKMSVYETDSHVLVNVFLDEFKTKEVNVLIQIKLDETIEVTVSEVATNKHITIFLNSEDTNE